MKEILQEVLTEIKKMFQEAFKNGYSQAKYEIHDYFKYTEKRLYAFKQLQKNVNNYKKDIEDLKKEGKTGKSKDIVMMKQSGIRLDDDEILACKIAIIEKKMFKDLQEIEEVKRALRTIDKMIYNEIIHYKYFDELSDSQIAQKLHVSDRTVRRNRKELINKIMIALYGIDAIKF